MKNDYVLLDKLARCYFRGSLNFSLQPEDVEIMTWEWQQKFIETTANSELIEKYPLRGAFSKLFFKKLLSYLENQEVHDELYSHLCQALNKESSDNNFCYRHHVVGEDLHNIITIKETNKMVVHGTTGMRTWEAALMLADWAICNKDIFCDRKVLELGSGVGFTGVTIAKFCAPQSVIMTDCHNEVMKTVCENIRINFPEISVEETSNGNVFKNKILSIAAMNLDWNAVEEVSSSIIPDIVIGADIVYDPVIIQPLCDVLKTFFDRNIQLDIYIASVIRNEDTFQAFLNSLDNMNFSYKKLHLDKSTFIEWDQSIEKCLLQVNCCK